MNPSRMGTRIGEVNFAIKIATNQPTNPRNSRVIPRIVDNIADINKIARAI